LVAAQVGERILHGGFTRCICFETSDNLADPEVIELLLGPVFGAVGVLTIAVNLRKLEVTSENDTAMHCCMAFNFFIHF